MECILHFIGTKIDWGQFGGQHGMSVAHYLVELLTFIHFNQEFREQHAVLAAMVDFHKAFNNQNHGILLTILTDMGLPGWLLRVIKGFLTEREMNLSYKGERSDNKQMPGGGSQGTILGMVLFIVLINSVGFKEHKKTIGAIITSNFKGRQAIQTTHSKFIDDLTIAESINLKKSLQTEQEDFWLRPLPFHSRTEHTLKSHTSKVQVQMDTISDYAKTNEMEINKKKTKVMIFNNAKKWDFLPKIKIDNDELEVVESMKILGTIVTSDLKWNANTHYMTTRGYSKLWILRILKNLSANNEELKLVYEQQVRCVVEFSSPVWAGLIIQDVELVWSLTRMSSLCRKEVDED